MEGPKGRGDPPHLLQISSKNPDRVRPVQDAFYCFDILCPSCDNSLGPIEGKAKRCLVDLEWDSFPVRRDRQGFYSVELGAEWVEPLTRFLLSVLCRAHWTATEPFEAFSIGPFAERIGDFRARDGAELVREFPWVMTRWSAAVSESGEVLPPTCLTQVPQHLRTADSRRCIALHFCGFTFMVKMDSQPWTPAAYGTSPVQYGRPIHVHCFPISVHPEFRWMARSINPDIRIE